MARSVVIVLILAHLFLPMIILAQASGTVGSGPQLPAPERKAEVETAAEQPSSSADQPHLSTEGEDDDGLEAEAPASSRRLGKHKGGTDASVAGGGVILGGLATAILAAVVSYIRVTRRKTNVSV
uniref:Transmembrane protein n=1 Tax=Kalanchoe fedtschenkoi TaxID=63787 RepID=A0A7N0RJR4_KALFE